MKDARRALCRATIFLLPVAFVACNATFEQLSRMPSEPPPPGPTDSNSAGLGISLVIWGKGLPVKCHPEVVLFVRLEDGEAPQDLTGDRKRALIPSTCIRDNRVYLLNAAPGTYVAVAGLRRNDLEPTTAHWKGFDVNLDDGKSVDCFYFPKKMIADSMTTVESGSFAFMGSYSTVQEFDFEDADELQVQVKKLQKGMDRSALPASYYHDREAQRVTLKSTRKEPEAESAFLRDAKHDLEGTAWVGMLDGLPTKP